MSEFTIKDSLVSFKSPAVTDITSAKVYFEPVQEGSGDPSPENVRPITGWTEATLYKTGKNLFDKSKYYNLPSEYEYVDSSYKCKAIQLLPNTAYTLTCNSDTAASSPIILIHKYSHVNTAGFLDLRKVTDVKTFTTDSTGKLYIGTTATAAATALSVFNARLEAVNVQIEPGTQVTAYEPYSNGPVLPSEYQEVEYIQGTSNARIDTGVQGNNDGLVISGKVYLNKFSAYQGFFGNYIDEDYNTSRLILDASANGAVIADINRRAANSSAPGVGFYAGNVGEFKISKTKLIFNGTEYPYRGVNNATANDTNILLNVANPALTTSNSELYRRWYYFRINDGNTALRNYIPCYRKSDNKPGMYDTVTNQFFASSGTEEFTAGPNVYYDTIPVSWETEAGTVYGGYVDLVEGEVVAEWIEKTFSASTYVENSGVSSVDSSLTWFTNRISLANIIDTPTNGDSNGFVNIGDWRKGPITGRCRAYSGSNGYLRFVHVSGEFDLTTSEGRTSYYDNLTSRGIVPTVVCRLSVPTTYQLTSQQLQTLKGVNNIWGNTNSDTEITYKVADTLKMTQIRKNILMSQPHVETVTSEGIASFKTDLAAPVKDCKVYFSPVQEGSGDPSPDNVRPISGWTEIDVGASNENLFPKEPPTEYVYKRSTGGSGYTWANATNARASAVIPYPYNQTIYIQKPSSDKGTSANISLGDTRILNIGTKYYTNEGFTNITDLTYTNPEHRKYLNLYCSNLTNFNNTFGSRQFMVSIGSSRKTYVAPQGTMHWIDFSDIGTIYGGYVDIVKGEIVKYWSVRTLDGTTAVADSLTHVSDTSDFTNCRGCYSVKIADLPNDVAYNNTSNFFCSHFKWITYSSRRIMRPDVDIAFNSSKREVIFCSSTFTTLEEFNNYFKELYDNGTPIQLAYKLATPNTYQLDPETIKTLKGINNIWSNANGNISIQYYTH